MFVRTCNTIVVKTAIALDSGIASLVLIPLPDTQESVEDIGCRLYGLTLGSAVLVPSETKVRPREDLLHCIELTRIVT